MVVADTVQQDMFTVDEETLIWVEFQFSNSERCFEGIDQITPLEQSCYGYVSVWPLLWRWAPKLWLKDAAGAFGNII